MTIKEQFKLLMKFFERENLDYAVIGAFALYAYGYIPGQQVILISLRESNTKKRLLSVSNRLALKH